MGSAVAMAATSPGQAGSAAMVSAIAEPNTAARSLIQGGRIFALGVSRVAVWLILPDSRHHRAAAGSSSGSGCSAAASTTRWARSGRLGAALGEVLGQLWPEAVGADARVDGVDELAESCDCGASASDRVHGGVLQEPLDGARP